MTLDEVLDQIARTDRELEATPVEDLARLERSLELRARAIAKLGQCVLPEPDMVVEPLRRALENTRRLAHRIEDLRWDLYRELSLINRDCRLLATLSPQRTPQPIRVDCAG